MGNVIIWISTVGIPKGCVFGLGRVRKKIGFARVGETSVPRLPEMSAWVLVEGGEWNVQNAALAVACGSPGLFKKEAAGIPAGV